jgi:hypothetical protein
VSLIEVFSVQYLVAFCLTLRAPFPSRCVFSRVKNAAYTSLSVSDPHHQSQHRTDYLSERALLFINFHRVSSSLGRCAAADDDSATLAFPVQPANFDKEAPIQDSMTSGLRP